MPALTVKCVLAACAGLRSCAKGKQKDARRDCRIVGTNVLGKDVYKCTAGLGRVEPKPAKSNAIKVHLNPLKAQSSTITAQPSVVKAQSEAAVKAQSSAVNLREQELMKRLNPVLHGQFERNERM